MNHSDKVKLEDLNSWDSVAKLLKMVDDTDTHIITLTGKDGRKYWVHREEVKE
jgi:hypothetical protein